MLEEVSIRDRMKVLFIESSVLTPNLWLEIPQWKDTSVLTWFSTRGLLTSPECSVGSSAPLAAVKKKKPGYLLCSHPNQRSGALGGIV